MRREPTCDWSEIDVSMSRDEFLQTDEAACFLAGFCLPVDLLAIACPGRRRPVPAACRSPSRIRCPHRARRRLLRRVCGRLDSCQTRRWSANQGADGFVHCRVRRLSGIRMDFARCEAARNSKSSPRNGFCGHARRRRADQLPGLHAICFLAVRTCPTARLFPVPHGAALFSGSCPSCLARARELKSACSLGRFSASSQRSLGRDLSRLRSTFWGSGQQIVPWLVERIVSRPAHDGKEVNNTHDKIIYPRGDPLRVGNDGRIARGATVHASSGVLLRWRRLLPRRRLLRGEVIHR